MANAKQKFVATLAPGADRRKKVTEEQVKSKQPTMSQKNTYSTKRIVSLGSDKNSLANNLRWGQKNKGGIEKPSAERLTELLKKKK